MTHDPDYVPPQSFTDKLFAELDAKTGSAWARMPIPALWQGIERIQALGCTASDIDNFLAAAAKAGKVAAELQELRRRQAEWLAALDRGEPPVAPGEYSEEEREAMRPACTLTNGDVAVLREAIAKVMPILDMMASPRHLGEVEVAPITAAFRDIRDTVLPKEVK